MWEVCTTCETRDSLYNRKVRAGFEPTAAGKSTPSAYHLRGGRRPDPSAYLWRFPRLIHGRTTLFASRLSVTRSITTTELSPVFSQTELPARKCPASIVSDAVCDREHLPPLLRWYLDGASTGAPQAVRDGRYDRTGRVDRAGVEPARAATFPSPRRDPSSQAFTLGLPRRGQFLVWRTQSPLHRGRSKRTGEGTRGCRPGVACGA